MALACSYSILTTSLCKVAVVEVADTVIMREPIRIPSRSSIADVEQAATVLEATAQLFASKCKDRASGEAVASVDWKQFSSALSHPLSMHWMARRRRGVGREVRAIDEELAVLASYSPRLVNGLKSGEAQSILLLSRSLCAAHLDAPDCFVREGAVGLDRDADGTSVLFCSPHQATVGLSKWAEDLLCSDLPPVVCATAAMAVLLNLHPFNDGNGRCARSWFSAIVAWRAGIDLDRFPLRSAIDASNGGFELRLRDAEINGRWGPLFDYMSTVFQIATDAQDGILSGRRGVI